jgi:hypothetical protein
VTVLFLSLEIVAFTFEEQRVIIRFLHLRSMKPIKIHQQLSETCSDGIMDMKNVRSWVQFTEGRTSCEDRPKEPPPRTSRSEDVNARVEQMAMFWDSEGVILTHCVPKGTTVTGETYESVLQMKFLPALREKEPKKNAAVLLDQDNAPPHRVALVHQFFHDNNFEVVPHAPYSPDLASLMNFNGFQCHPSGGITHCFSNVNVKISSDENSTVTRRRHKHSTHRTVLPFHLTQPKEQPRLFQHSRFYLLLFPRKKLGDLKTLTHHDNI